MHTQSVLLFNFMSLLILKMYFLTRITKIVVRLKLDRFSTRLKLMDNQDDSIPLLLTTFKKKTPSLTVSIKCLLSHSSLLKH